ncbi:MlaC/ttg2D family ABC transporter substrate-binding protein [Magnetococcales bacterium HHB-1]
MVTHHHRLFWIIPLFLLTLTLIKPVEAGAPTDQIREVFDQTIEILKRPDLQGDSKRDERRQILRSVIFKNFDFHRISQSTLGRKWRKFSKDQQGRFVLLFAKLLEGSYIDKIESYQNESYKFTKELQDEEITRVDSVILSKGQEYHISYSMHQVQQEWKIFDIRVEGISLIASYRPQFARYLQKHSADDLLQYLEQKTSKSVTP